MVIDQVDITYGDKTEKVYVRRMKFRKRARLISDLNAKTRDGRIDPLAMSEFMIEMLYGSLCTSEGKDLYTGDQLDEWDDEKLAVYFNAVMKYQNPTFKEVAKNS